MSLAAMLTACTDRKESAASSKFRRAGLSVANLNIRDLSWAAMYDAPGRPRHGSNIGQPLTRRNGILKVTGTARYAADHHPPGMVFAVLAGNSIARGRVSFLDVAAANCHPGVVDVMPPAHKPRLMLDPDAKSDPFTVR